MKMDAHYSKNTTAKHVTKALTTHPVKTRNFTDESGGFVFVRIVFILSLTSY